MSDTPELPEHEVLVSQAIAAIESRPARDGLGLAAPIIRRFCEATGEPMFGQLADTIDMVLAHVADTPADHSLASRTVEIQLDDLRIAAVTLIKTAAGLCTAEEADRVIAETTSGKIVRTSQGHD